MNCWVWDPMRESPGEGFLGVPGDQGGVARPGQPFGSHVGQLLGGSWGVWGTKEAGGTRAAFEIPCGAALGGPGGPGQPWGGGGVFVGLGQLGGGSNADAASLL